MLIWYSRQTHRSPEDSKARKCPECNKVRLLSKSILKIQFDVSGVRFHACIFDASANARLGSPLSPVWKDLLTTVAVERTHADTHRRKALRVSHLWKVFLWQVKPEGSPSNSCGCKSEEIVFHFIHKPTVSSTAFQLQQMWKRICPQVISCETWRGGMYQQLNNWRFGNVFVRKIASEKASTFFHHLSYQWLLLSWWKRTWFVKYLCLKSILLKASKYINRSMAMLAVLNVKLLDHS